MEKFSERGSCTVRTLAKVTGIELVEAFKIADAAGRRNGCGFRSAKLIAFVNKHTEFRFIDEKPRRMSLKTFCREFPRGRYYVRIREHALPVIDGKIMDGTRPGSIVKGAWRLHQPS